MLSGRTDLAISPETRARVLDAAKKLGYRPNPAARALTNGRTGLVGFWMSLDYSRYRGQVLDHMRTLLAQTEMALAVTDVDKEYTWLHSFERPLRVPVDGIIAFDNSASVEAFARDHDRLAPGVPFVSMGAYWSEVQSFVGVDLRAGADEAMDHLLATGRKQIAYMAPWTSELIDSGPRFEAYSTKMAEAGLPTTTISIESVSYSPIKDAVVRHYERGTLPDAILCMNDDIAIAVSYVLEGLGIKVGHDIALVGFDGIEEAEHCLCPITTVRQPVAEMCQLTYRFLKAQMDDPDAPPQQRILKTELVIRESTRR